MFGGGGGDDDGYVVDDGVKEAGTTSGASAGAKRRRRPLDVEYKNIINAHYHHHTVDVGCKWGGERGGGDE
jgi:hypothetical protein